MHPIVDAPINSKKWVSVKNDAIPHNKGIL